MIPRPAPENFGPNFGKYISLVPEGDIRTLLATQLTESLPLLRGISEPDSLLRHAPYTWSLREVLGHITDTERIFACRALRFARGDSTPLPSFDENAFAAAAQFDRIPWPELTTEFEHTRRANILMANHFSPEAWTRQGTASNTPLTVTALIYAIVGHTRHHMDIVKKRIAK